MIGNVKMLNLVQALRQIVEDKPEYARRLGSPCRFTGKTCTDHGGREVAGTALRALSLARR